MGYKFKYNNRTYVIKNYISKIDVAVSKVTLETTTPIEIVKDVIKYYMKVYDNKYINFKSEDTDYWESTLWIIHQPKFIKKSAGYENNKR